MTNAAPEGLFCLRCAVVALRRLPESMAAMAFFECPACHRHYARAPGKALTFRWLHPISLALQPALSFSGPLAGERQTAVAMARNKAPAEVAAMADEIELELEAPTQRVREILGNAASEEACRAFLADVVRELRAQR